MADLTVKTLMSICSDQNFELFWENTLLRAKTLDLSEPCLPRQRQVPKRFEGGSAAAEFASSAHSYFR